MFRAFLQQWPPKRLTPASCVAGTFLLVALWMWWRGASLAGPRPAVRIWVDRWGLDCGSSRAAWYWRIHHSANGGKGIERRSFGGQWSPGRFGFTAAIQTQPRLIVSGNCGIGISPHFELAVPHWFVCGLLLIATTQPGLVGALWRRVTGRKVPLPPTPIDSASPSVLT